MENQKSWIEKLKPGDKVLRTRGNLFPEEYISKVTHIDEKYVYIENASFSKKTGIRKDTGNDYISFLTQEKEEELSRKSVINNARCLMNETAGKIGYEAAIKIVEILKEFQNQTGGYDNEKYTNGFK